MVKGKPQKRPTVWLRALLGDESKRYLYSYLNSEFPDTGRVVGALVTLGERSERMYIGTYEGQYQVSAVFAPDDGNSEYGVSGLGDTVDLAVLTCYAKCEFEHKWNFVQTVTEPDPHDKPRFA